MRKPLVLVAIGSAAVIVAGSAAIAVAQGDSDGRPSHRDAPDAVVKSDVMTPDPGYWTPDRMKDAQAG
ncbi:hypothetical protein [Wenjunlia tyrosinilytica]|jgi:hypothetical protein|uniref:Uncharacterized protein n=1 Tax=Wenjunlia tyrosinilytica TaxID=1544741 RepID=A0A918DZJ2_9ACTN|nr:hypothetical protein [Wenjunlia tyrosinilytica]GGO94096.1 hypothetical protein GCM10012280_48140 [Wenjunlia tyrosinilytica]